MLDERVVIIDGLLRSLALRSIKGRLKAWNAGIDYIVKARAIGVCLAMGSPRAEAGCEERRAHEHTSIEEDDRA